MSRRGSGKVASSDMPGNQGAWRKSDSYDGNRNLARRSMVAIYKLEHGCADCGYDANPVVLDLDHRPGTTKRWAVGKAIASLHPPLHELIEEIEKCDVVCANCHRIRTEERRTK